MEIMKAIASCFLLLVSLFLFSYFIIRPLDAIGNIPIEIRKLRESIDKLVDELRRDCK